MEAISPEVSKNVLKVFDDKTHPRTVKKGAMLDKVGPFISIKCRMLLLI